MNEEKVFAFACENLTVLGQPCILKDYVTITIIIIISAVPVEQFEHTFLCEVYETVCPHF